MSEEDWCYLPKPKGGVQTYKIHLFTSNNNLLTCQRCGINRKEVDMKPPKQERDENFEYEKVSLDDFVPGKIEDIQYDPEHKFVYQGTTTERPGVRLKFKLDGYEHSHYSQWLTFSYGEKTNLFKIYISALVENAEPDFDFDMDTLKGMKVKTLWKETKSGFQFPSAIRRVRGEKEEYVEPEGTDEAPF